jgi:homoserine kinase type II
LFRDNVLFLDGRLSGMLDFYSACHGELLFDVAIAVNDWCCDDGVINPEKMTALLSSYQSIRPLEVVEKQLWPMMLRRAALRFWLARLAFQNRARTGALVQQKDPLVFRRILEQHRQAACAVR